VNIHHYRKTSVHLGSNDVQIQAILASRLIFFRALVASRSEICRIVHLAIFVIPTNVFWESEPPLSKWRFSERNSEKDLTV
ncbi:hypothetical protein PFISCL1PPCAC_7455, partial [Pristionchus fissidentatus]